MKNQARSKPIMGFFFALDLAGIPMQIRQALSFSLL
jgi:hypothetical protein